MAADGTEKGLLQGSPFSVPGAGVEPAQPLQPLVFETSASTDSAIRARSAGTKVEILSGFAKNTVDNKSGIYNKTV